MVTLRKAYTLSILLVIAVSLNLVPLASAQGDNPPTPQGLRPDAPPYAVHGPYAVGTREFVIDEGSDPLFPVTVWYPAINPNSAEESITYMLDYPPLFPGLPVEGHAIANAVPDTENGPYPLVLFSHGAFGWRYTSPYFTEHLASFGFVVIAGDHIGDTLVNVEEEDAFVRAHVSRPKDITRWINYAETLTAESGALAGLIDTERVAVSGDSSGGWTTLLAAGAQRDYTALDAWCADHPDDVWTCGNLLGQEQMLADLLGLQAVPEGLWPAVGDPRVDAIVLLAPGNIPAFGRAGLASITIPALTFGSTGDSLLPFEEYAYRAYEDLGSARKALVGFEHADHQLYVDACSATPWIIDMGWFFFCSDPVWDMNRAHDLINHFTTAFLLAELYGDADAAAALAPDVAQFPGIRYETTGF